VYLEVRGVERHDHQQPGDQTSTGQRDDPSGEDETNLLPVYGLEIEVAERNADGRASETLSSRNRQCETGGEEDGDGGAELHREPTGGRDLRDLIAERAHNVVAVEPETNAEEKTSNDKDPDGCVGFLGDDAGGVGVVRSYPGADGVCNCEVR
jgi:hypothetical protein